MSAAWAFVAGWCSAALFIGAGCLISRRRKRRFDSSTQFAAAHGWPETYS